MGKHLLFFTTAIIICLTPCVQASDLYSVQLGSFESRAKAVENVSSTKGLNDLWIDEFQGATRLCAGIFPSSQYAKLLLEQIKDRFPEAKVVTTAMPGPHTWLPIRHTTLLKDLGYERPLLLSGVDPYLAFSFPWSSAMATKGAVLTLMMNTSGFIKPVSSVTVTVEGIPLKSLSVPEIQGSRKIRIPLDALNGMDIGESLDIQISGTLSATDNRCVDILSKNLWIMVQNNSSLQTHVIQPPQSVRQFFMAPTSTYNISFNGEDKHSKEALLKISGLIGSTSRCAKSRIRFSTYLPGARNVFIGDFPKDIQVCGSNLFITPKGANLIASRWLGALVFPSMNGQLKDGRPSQQGKDISFEQLGYNHRTARGETDLSFFIDFSPIQLGGWPQRLICTVLFAHTPIGEQERCFLRIRLNGVLLEAHEIQGEGGQKSLVFEIPTRYLHERNYLEFAFSHYLNTGNCIGSYPDFEVSIFKDSFLSVTSFDPQPPLTIGTCPGIFQGKGAIVVGEMEPGFLKTASRLLELLGFLQKKAPDISLTRLSELKKGGFEYALVVTGQQDATMPSPPVEIGPRFVIKNPLTGEEIVRIDTSDPVSIIETFYSKENSLPILLFGQRNTRVFPEKPLTSLFVGHTRANVGIMSQDEWYALEVGKKFRVVYPDKHGLDYYWVRYRIILFIIFGAVALVFFFYVYHRLAKEK